MNSVTRHITVDSLAATLIAMRSGRKEVFLVVEGGKDVSIYSQVFGLSESNFLDCRGKENLDALYGSAPRKGLDAGTVFLRDRDFNAIKTQYSNFVLLIVTDLYDVEMHLLSGRIFHRLVSEYLAARSSTYNLDELYYDILEAAAYVGALRLISENKQWCLDFSNLKFDFVDPATLRVNAAELVRKVAARSHSRLVDQDQIISEIEGAVAATKPLEVVVRGKDFLEVLHIALHRRLRCCSSAECSPDLLGRIIRIAAVISDFSSTQFLVALKAHITTCPFPWSGTVAF